MGERNGRTKQLHSMGIYTAQCWRHKMKIVSIKFTDNNAMRYIVRNTGTSVATANEVYDEQI